MKDFKMNSDDQLYNCSKKDVDVDCVIFISYQHSRTPVFPNVVEIIDMSDVMLQMNRGIRKFLT